jgi:hypothetical protein
MQHVRVLHQVRAQQQPPPRSRRRPRAQEGLRLLGREVAERRAGKEADAAPAPASGSGQALRVVGGHRLHVQLGKLGAQQLAAASRRCSPEMSIGR